MTADASESVPLDLDTEHLNARVAWYYYVGGLTQQEIADKLGLTRLRVNKIIGQARANGSVHIEIRMPLAACVELEEAVKARYGLVDVIVVPNIDDVEQQKQVIGEAAGRMLEALLRDGQSIGVGWGRTLVAVARRLTPRQFRRSHVVSVMGGQTRGSGANTFEVASELARVLGAECHYIPSPLYYADDESFASLMSHGSLSAVLDEARRAEIVLVSCGDLSGRSQLFSAMPVTPQELNELKGKGAVGEILGTFLDAAGEPIDHPLNRRVMALLPSELRKIPITILASGDIYKLRVVRAVLDAGYVNRLVTDESVAEGLL